MVRCALLASVFLLAASSEACAQGLTERATFKGHTFAVNRTAFSPDFKILASGGGNTRGGELKLWDVATGAEIAALVPYTNSLHGLVFSPNGRLLVSASYGLVQLWDVTSCKLIAAHKHGDILYGAVFSGDSKKVAATSSRQTKVWDVATGMELTSFTRPNPHYGLTALSPDLKLLALPDYQEIDLFDISTGKARITLSEHLGQVGYLAFTSDGKTLIAASQLRSKGPPYKGKGDLKLWDVATGKARVNFHGPFGLISEVAPSPDGKFLALLDTPELRASPDLKLLEVASGRQTIIPNPAGYAFVSFTFTTDQLLIVGTPDDKSLKLWAVSLPQ